MSNKIVYEIGIKDSQGKYKVLHQSDSEQDVDNYAELIASQLGGSITLLKLVKTYQLVSTTPHVIKEQKQNHPTEEQLSLLDKLFDDMAHILGKR